MQKRTLPTARAVASTFVELVRQGVSCRRQGDFLLLDTPLILQDGHLLQALIEIDETDSIRVSDGGFVQRQILLSSHSAASIRERGMDAAHLCKEVGLVWEGEEIAYQAENLEDALRRISTLARTVDRSLSTLQVKPPRKPVALREQLRKQLQSAGLKVQSKVRITRIDEPKVVVDQVVRRNGSQAAVEVLSGKTHGGAVISVDRAIANFHVLSNLKYQGLLFAVYDEGSPAAESDLRSRFQNARPGAAVLLAGSEAASAIESRLLESA